MEAPLATKLIKVSPATRVPRRHGRDDAIAAAMGATALPELSLEAGDPILFPRSGSGGVPSLDVSVLKVFRAKGGEREEPRNQPVPRGRVTGWQELPAELLQRPIGFGAVQHHRGRHPVVGSVGSTAGDRNEVVDRREQLPEGDVALRHLPVWVCGKLFGQQTGEKTQGSGEHQRGAGVPVEEAVTEEHGGGHGRSDGGPAGGLRCERVLAPGDLGGLTPVTFGESFADPLEGSGPVVERSHWDEGDPTDRTERTDLWSGGKWTG